MENKRNHPRPASSQVVEPPLKQHKWEADAQDFEQLWSQINHSVFDDSCCSPAFRSSLPRSSSFGAFEQEWSQINHSVFGDSCSPAFRSSLRRSSSTPPAFDDSSILQMMFEAVSKEMELKAIQTAKQAAFGATSTLPFGTKLFPEVFGDHTPFSLISVPAITEEDGGTSGQTERYQSCFAIAGADYCVIAADSTRGHTNISKLSTKCAMASCGFQDDMKALQEALSAENLKYEYEHNKPMSCPEMRRLLSDFEDCHPNHVFIVLGGLDSEGKGRVFKLYGPGAVTIASEVGHPGSRLIVPPILKCELPAKDVLARLSLTEAVSLAEDVFKSATNTGDKLEIFILNADGLTIKPVDLREEKKKKK